MSTIGSMAFELIKLALAGLISLGVSWCFWRIRIKADAKRRAWEESLRWFEDHIDSLGRSLAVFRAAREGRLDYAIFMAVRHLSTGPVVREPGLVHRKRLEGTELLKLHNLFVALLHEHGLGKPEEISLEQIMEIPGEVFDRADALLDQMAFQINELRERGPGR